MDVFKVFRKDQYDNIEFTKVIADSEEEAIEKAKSVPDEDWEEDTTPRYEYEAKAFEESEEDVNPTDDDDDDLNTPGEEF